MDNKIIPSEIDEVVEDYLEISYDRHKAGLFSIGSKWKAVKDFEYGMMQKVIISKGTIFKVEYEQREIPGMVILNGKYKDRYVTFPWTYWEFVKKDK